MELSLIDNKYENHLNEFNFSITLNNEIYYTKVNKDKEFIIIKTKTELNKEYSYISSFNYDNLINLSKSMKKFDNLNSIFIFIKEKSEKNEIFMVLQKNNLYLKFKLIDSKEKSDEVFLPLSPHQNNFFYKKSINFNILLVAIIIIIIIFLVIKIIYLENEVKNLNKKINEQKNIIIKNKKDILSLSEKIEILSNKIIEKENIKFKPDIEIDSKITTINEIEFIINRLKKRNLIKNENFKFKLLFRGTRDGDDTYKLHKICDKKQNIIIFMKNDQGKNYGGFSHIGWESRPEDKWEYYKDNDAFLFSLDNKKIFNAIKEKVNICWRNSDEYGLCFYESLYFYNNFLAQHNTYVSFRVSECFENCLISEFISENEIFKLLELEVFEII